MDRLVVLPLALVFLQGAPGATGTPSPSAPPAQDTTALRRERQFAELEKIRAEIRKVQAETSNLENGFLKYVPLVTALVGVFGAGVALYKYFDDRKSARRLETSTRVDTLLGLLAGADPHSRITAAVSLGVVAAAEEAEIPGLRRTVIENLLAKLASNPSAAEQATFASVVSGLLAGSAEQIGAPPAGADLSGVDFHGRTLRDVDFTESVLTRTSFRGATLDGVRLERVRQGGRGGVDFESSTLRNVEFVDADLHDVSFHGATVDNLVFTRCKLNVCRFTGLKGEVRLRFESCKILFKLSFEGTDLSNLAIVGSDDVDPSTLASLAAAQGIASATLDAGLKEKIQAAQTKT